ncbi:hypothetical protein [Clostridium akagii]|uniref:hypothetical protein n=1 Tax=Clostridium akagii TaxID=91623 RepID=UPI00047A8E56|nr:hypothetical protein [Clostridium akagii]
MGNIYFKFPFIYISGAKITPFLILVVLMIISIVYDYIKFKMNLKNVKITTSGRDIYLKSDWSLNWKIQMYYIIIFFLLHMLTVKIL